MRKRRTNAVHIILIVRITFHLLLIAARAAIMERKAANLTQEQFAEISEIGLHTLRELEQGKDNITLHKINQALAMFGSQERHLHSFLLDNGKQ